MKAKEHLGKKVLSVFLSVLMIVSVIPIASMPMKAEGKEPACNTNSHMAYQCCEDRSEIITAGAAIQTKTVNIEETAHSFTGDYVNIEIGKHARKCVNDGCEAVGIGLTAGETEECSGGTATCQEKAVCMYCSGEYGQIDPENHDLVEHSAQAPTCAADGWEEYVACSRCDYTTYRKIDALCHTEVIDCEKEPTCGTTGLTEGKHCSVCGAITVPQQMIPAKEHANIVIDAAVEPTCAHTGLTEGSHCKDCATVIVYQLVQPKKPHNYVKTVIAPTCTADGFTKYICRACGDSYEESVVPATGHIYIEQRVAPACEKDGYDYMLCVNCRDEYIVSEIPATGHTDIDKDGICDSCRKDISAAECTCLCHSDNFISRIIYAMLKFLWKSFGINKTCSCGNIHY